MALALIASGSITDIRQGLDEVQLEQFQHDEMYHREIARLGAQDRFKHMALHFAKYVGNFVEAGEDGARQQRLLTDVFIIGTSCANMLNLKLADVVPKRGAAAVDDKSGFVFTLTVHMGRMAAACEKLDHLEDFPFRPVIRDAVVGIVGAAISHAEGQCWDLRELVRERLSGVKRKSMFHGRL